MIFAPPIRRNRRDTSGQPVLIKQIYQLADFFRKMQQKNRDLKRNVEAIRNKIPTLETDIHGLNEKLTTSDEKILVNQRQLTKNLDAFNEHSSLIMDHDHDLSKLQQSQVKNEKQFEIVTNNTNRIIQLDEIFDEHEISITNKFERVDGRLLGFQGLIKTNEDDVDTRLLLIDSGLRFFNDTVYRDQKHSMERIRSIREELSEFNINIDLKVSILENQLRPEIENSKKRNEKFAIDLSEEMSSLAQVMDKNRLDIGSAMLINKNQTRMISELHEKTVDLDDEFTNENDRISLLVTAVRKCSNNTALLAVI